MNIHKINIIDIVYFDIQKKMVAASLAEPTVGPQSLDDFLS